MSQETQALFAKAYQQQTENNLPEAISIYEQLLKLVPEHQDALHFIGLAHAQLGAMDIAIDYLLTALALYPADATLHNNLGNAYKKTQRWEKAIEHYKLALHLNPDYAQAHNNLATLYAQQELYQPALNHYRQALHAQPDFVAAHYNLGLLLLKNNELDAAQKQFTNVLALYPDHIEAHFYLGVLHLEAGRLDEAEQAFKIVLDLDSEHVEAITNLGVLALKRDQGQLAVDYFSKALVIDNNHLDARNNLAATFIHHDRFENALMHYDVLLKNDDKNIEYLYNMGVAQMALGHLQEAITHFENILTQQPNHFAALNNLAAIHIRLEQRELAIYFLQRALAANPGDKATQFMLHALTGSEKNPEASTDYVNNLFNNYALNYDQHMQGLLKYALPQHIARVLHQLNYFKFEQTIDLGCGTGLSGIVLREMSHRLIGVDIAAKMLAQANDKNIYDQLLEAELITFLEKDSQSYDLAVAADVLPYFGDLNDLFRLISQHLNDQGLFVFTCELSPDKPWVLQPSARFSQHPDYIKKLCDQYGLNLIYQEKIAGRQQHEEVLELMLYVAQASHS